MSLHLAAHGRGWYVADEDEPDEAARFTSFAAADESARRWLAAEGGGTLVYHDPKVHSVEISGSGVLLADVAVPGLPLRLSGLAEEKT